MQVQILTPEKELFNGVATLVKLPGKDGSFELLDNHTEMVYALKKGQVKIITAQKEESFFDIEGGILEVSKNKVILLAD